MPATAWNAIYKGMIRLALGWALAAFGFAAPALAANCNIATSQGATGPANWQTYCWIDFSTYNDTTARSGSGQNFSLTLQDGTVMSFNMKVVTPGALSSVTSPSWSGAAVGNTAFLGIGGSRCFTRPHPAPRPSPFPASP